MINNESIMDTMRTRRGELHRLHGAAAEQEILAVADTIFLEPKQHSAMAHWTDWPNPSIAGVHPAHTVIRPHAPPKTLTPVASSLHEGSHEGGVFDVLLCLQH